MEVQSRFLDEMTEQQAEIFERRLADRLAMLEQQKGELWMEAVIASVIAKADIEAVAENGDTRRAYTLVLRARTLFGCIIAELFPHKSIHEFVTDSQALYEVEGVREELVATSTALR